MEYGLHFSRLTAVFTSLVLFAFVSCDSGDDSPKNVIPENTDAPISSSVQSSPLNSDENTVILAADAWPPFNGTAGEEPEGYMIDIAREIFSEAGFSIRYVNTSWNRAIYGSVKGDFDGAVGASRSDGKGLVFPNQELGRNYLAFYVKKGNPWQFSGIESLKNVSIGVIESYDYRPWLTEYVKDNRNNPFLVQSLTGDRALERNIEKLITGRVDVIVDNEASIRYVAKSRGKLDFIECAGYGEQPAFIYIAFTPASPRGRKLADILSSGIETMRRNGRLQEILDNYGIQDWRKQYE